VKQGKISCILCFSASCSSTKLLLQYSARCSGVASSVSAQVALQLCLHRIYSTGWFKLHPLFQPKSLFNMIHYLDSSGNEVLHPLFQRKSLFNLSPSSLRMISHVLHPLFQRKSLFNNMLSTYIHLNEQCCILCFSASRSSTKSK